MSWLLCCSSLVARRLSCLLVLLYSSIVVPSSWPCWIYLYIGISSCRLSCLLCCLSLVVALIVYCVISYLLLSLVVIACRDSIRFVCRCLLSCLVLLRRCSQWTLLATVATLSGTPGDRPQGGGDFLIGGDRLPKPAPSPFLRTRSKKMRFFSAKQGKNGKNLRKRKRD